ncbi:signal recognition particle protein [Candidatus Dependentiae bacterium]|nr:signal recognition particle protein [Candidatus Dependentiae bacterium]
MFDFLSEKFSGILTWMKGKGTLSEKNIADALTQVKNALLQADVPLNVVTDFLTELSQEVSGQTVHKKLNPGDHFIKIVHARLVKFLDSTGGQEKVTFHYPSVVTVMGLQGSGKTTTIAKLAYWVTKEASKRNKKRRILLASIDFYRPAAVDQLEILANKIKIDFYRSNQTDVLEATKDIYTHFKTGRYELLILDTAGRLHVDDRMLEELKTVTKLVSPKHSFLVLDAMTGQESLNIAKKFDEVIGFNSAILTKMDSDTRGGAAFAFRYVLGKPIAFVGSGEKVDDLESFVPDRVATRILGMGDVLSLIEKAEEKIDQHQQETLTKRMMSGKFTLDDFAQQLGMVGKLGSLQKIAQYLPGMGSLSPDQLEQGQKEMALFKAILSSMTRKEKCCPQILDSSRKQRIAQGSGTNAQIINQLLQKFEQSKQFVKMFRKMGKFPSIF